MARDSEKSVITVKWSIENFSMCPMKKGECMKSPVFAVDALDYTRWQLRLYPKGDKDSDGESISCYLRRANIEKELEEITVFYSLSVVKADTKSIQVGEKNTSTLKKDAGYGYSNFLSLNTLFAEKNTFLPNDVLSVLCCIGRNSDVKDTVDFPNSSDEILTFISKDNLSTKQYGSHRFFRTRISVERREIKWTIQNFKARMQSKKRISLSVPSILPEKSELLLSCYVRGDWDSDGFLNINIQRKNANQKQMLLRCKVSVLDTSGDAQESREDEYLFEEDFEGWSFPPVVQLGTFDNHKPASPDGDALSMRFEFSISHEVTDISLEPNLQTKNLNGSEFLNRDVIELLNDGDLTDVTLISDEREFKVHKLIICARSPVFRAMFRNDTEEKRTGVVRITDVDSETMNTMIQFMYGEHVRELKHEEARNLYSAADKYQISTLKEQCVAFLKYHLCVSNVCDVLVLADMHQDSELLKHVRNFMRVHSPYVFKSKEWLTLMQNNMQLAGQTMHKVLVLKTDS